MDTTQETSAMKTPSQTPPYSWQLDSVCWEYEDNLPDLDACEYDHLFEKSEIRDGVRMFPYIVVYSMTDGTPTRHFLGA
jgi:hypothetical protein